MRAISGTIMQKPSVLFICVENSARSQMAEGFARAIAPSAGIDIFSAGTQPAGAVYPMAVDVMKDFGIDISRQHPKHFREVSKQHVSLAVTLCHESELGCPVLAGSPVNVHWSLDDPSTAAGSKEEVRDRFYKVAEKIKMLVFDLFDMGYFTAFVQHKENMENIINSLYQGIVAYDLDRRITFFSAGAEKITGLSATEVIGTDCHEMLGPPICGPNCVLCNNYDVNYLKPTDYTTAFYNADGERKECEVAITPIKDTKGNIKSIVASFTDCTNLKRLQRDLKEQKSFRNMIGRERKMLDVFTQIRDIAPYDYPVQISGETGTGKELVALAIHYESPRSSAPFVPVNCGALPETIIESELFGHVKGAFTGAIRDKKGRFELAEGGTIFLDEVAELSKSTQVKLLRILQEGNYERVGAEKVSSVNVRVISATNKDLKQEVKRGRFRDDLFFRLNVIPINLPPLRKRRNDIPLLVEHFLRQRAERNDGKQTEISDEAMSILMDYNWAGNIRELQNAIQFAIVKCRGNVINPDHLPAEVQEDSGRITRPGPSRKLDIAKVRSAIQKSGGKKTEAARILGVGRATLYRFIGDHPEVLDEMGEL